MGNTRKHLMFPKLHMTRNMKMLGYGIIKMITFLSETITKKTTESGSWFKFVPFVLRKSDKTSTTKNLK
jgi:hypothetical protein